MNLQFTSRVKVTVFVLSLSLILTACGTLEVKIEATATPSGALSTVAVRTATSDSGVELTVTALAAADATPTPSPHMDVWTTYSSSVFAVSLEHPADWQTASGYGTPEMGETRFSGINGFFHVSAMDAASIDDAASREAGHHLQPYGSQPIVENTRIQGQEARLILPSADQPIGMEGQASLIVRYPQPVNISGAVYRYFVLWADQPHIRTIAQTLKFDVDSAPIGTVTPMPPIAWVDLPPGLVYSTSEGLWLINADEQPMLIHDNPQAILSPDGTQLLSYEIDQQDLWLLDRIEGAISKLTETPDRLECCFQWWPERPGTVIFNSTQEGAERGPGLMGYLSAANLGGGEYQILDPEHDAGPGQFALSPDGQTIAYGGGSTGWLYRWGGVEIFDPADYGLTVRDGVQMAQPAWSPDGARLAWIVKGNLAVDGSMRVGVGVFDLETGTARIIHPYQPQGTGWPAAPVWSSDGNWLAFSDSSSSDQAGLWIARTGELWEEHHLGLGGNPLWSPDGKWLIFQSFQENGAPAYMLAEVGGWELWPLKLSPDRYGGLVDWIRVGGSVQ